MAKKFSLLMAAVAILAFAIPAMVSAAPSMTSKAGTTAPVPSTITATNVGHVRATGTPFGILTCATATLNGTLTVSTDTKFTANAGAGGTSASCNASGNPLTVTDLTLTHLESTTIGSGKASFTFVADLPGIVCRYTATNMPFTYVLGGSHITFSSALELIGSPKLCDAAHIVFDATFKIEIGGTAVILD